MNKKLANIILILIVLILLLIDALAVHDIIVGEPDILYEIAMILVSIIIFLAIGIYLKLRKQKSTQIP